MWRSAISISICTTHTHTPTDSCSLAYHASSNRMQDLARRPHYLCRHDGGLVQRNCSINSVTLMQGVLAFMPCANGQWRHRRSRSAVKVNYKVKNTTSTGLSPRGGVLRWRIGHLQEINIWQRLELLHIFVNVLGQSIQCINPTMKLIVM